MELWERVRDSPVHPIWQFWCSHLAASRAARGATMPRRAEWVRVVAGLAAQRREAPAKEEASAADIATSWGRASLGAEACRKPNAQMSETMLWRCSAGQGPKAACERQGRHPTLRTASTASSAPPRTHPYLR